MNVELMRCNDCRGFVQLKSETPKRCPKCFSQRQTIQAGELTQKEQCQIYHRTGIMVLNRGTSSLEKITLIARATLTGRKKDE